MKTLAMFFAVLSVLLLGTTEEAKAQFPIQVGNYEFSRANFGSGKGALTSGLDLTAIFKNGLRTLEITGNSDRAYIQHFWDVADTTLSAAASLGIFKNTPWLGYQLAYAPVKGVSINQWSGFSVATIGAKDWKPQWFFYQAGVTVEPNENISVGCTVIKFQGLDWDILLGAALTVPLNEDFSALFGADHSGLNKEIFYRIAVKYEPK
jgi:hypothetical protein